MFPATLFAIEELNSLMAIKRKAEYFPVNRKPPLNKNQLLFRHQHTGADKLYPYINIQVSPVPFKEVLFFRLQGI